MTKVNYDGGGGSGDYWKGRLFRIFVLVTFRIIVDVSENDN